VEDNSVEEVGDTTSKDPEKDLKGLKKKLRQIRQLKQRQSTGEMLDEMQKAKISKESEIVKKIQELEKKT